MYIGFILNGRNNLEYCRMLSSDANDRKHSINSPFHSKNVILLL